MFLSALLRRLGRTRRLRENADKATCPFCANQMTVIDGKLRPDPGDLTICMRCLSQCLQESLASAALFDSCDNAVRLHGGGFSLDWSAKGVGCGQLHFAQDPESGRVRIGNEMMSRAFIKRVLCCMVDDAALDDEPPPTTEADDANTTA